VTDQCSSVVVVPHTIVGDLGKAGIVMSGRTSTVGEVLAWQPTGGGEVVGFLAPAVVVKDGALIIIGLPGMAGERLARVLRLRLGVEEVAAIVIDDGGFGEAMRAAGFEIDASEPAVPLHLGEMEAVLEPSWRDDVPEAVQDDMDMLLEMILRFGREKLEQNGELVPFCLFIDPNDQVNVASANVGVAHADALVGALYEKMRVGMEEYRAFAVIQHRVTDRLGFLNVRLEHRDGPALICAQPYKKPRFRGGYKFIDEVTVAVVPHQVWGTETDDVNGDGE